MHSCIYSSFFSGCHLFLAVKVGHWDTLTLLQTRNIQDLCLPRMPSWTPSFHMCKHQHNARGCKNCPGVAGVWGRRMCFHSSGTKQRWWKLFLVSGDNLCCQTIIAAAIVHGGRGGSGEQTSTAGCFDVITLLFISHCGSGIKLWSNSSESQTGQKVLHRHRVERFHPPNKLYCILSNKGSWGGGHRGQLGWGGTEGRSKVFGKQKWHFSLKSSAALV